MDTYHRNDPGEEILDLPLERSPAGELDLGDVLRDEEEKTSFLPALDELALDDDLSAPMFGGPEPGSDGDLDLPGLLHDHEEETGLFSALDGVIPDEDHSSAPLIDDLLELNDDVWGPDGGGTADLLPGGALEGAVAGLAVEAAPADENAEPRFARPAPGVQPFRPQPARRGPRDVWAGMAPSRRHAIGIAGSAFAAVALVSAVWVQRPDVSEDVISTGRFQTTTSVAARRSPPPPTSIVPPATDTSMTPASDTSVAPAANGPSAAVGPASPAPSASGGPAAPRATVAGAAPSAPSAPATPAPAPARVNTTPATRAVETTEAPATSAEPAAPAPPATSDTTETTRRLRELPTPVTTEPPTPTTVAPTERSNPAPCSEFITRGPLACPPAE